MRRLVLARHAKSSWNFPELDDHDRPLNKRGSRDAPIMAARLASSELEVQAIYSSSALRALSFAEHIRDACECGLESNKSFYTFSASQFLSSVQSIDDGFECVVAVGHNPAITALTNQLADQDINNVPTSGLVALQFDVDRWCAISDQNCEFLWMDTPKRPRDL